MYEIWQRYYEEDGTIPTNEYVMSFDDYEKAHRFVEGLTRDPNCEAWIVEKT